MSHLVLVWGAQWFAENPFPYNEVIIGGDGHYKRFSKGYVYWGKFFREHDKNGGSKILEPGLREAYSKTEGTKLCDRFNKEIDTDSPVYLYLINPWFFDQPLTIGNVTRAFYTGEELPPSDEDGRPSCAHIPHYYFLYGKPVEECQKCRNVKSKCKLQFSCNFWFRVNQFLPVQHTTIMRHLYNLVYADGQVSEKGLPFDPVGAAYYPILVNQKQTHDFFRIKTPNEVLKARPDANKFKIVKEDKNEGKFGEEISSFFERLCREIMSITRIDTKRFGNFQRNYYTPHPDSLDIIIGYRSFKAGKADAALMFRISTTCSSGEEQALLVEYLNKYWT
jgi:hypothetical protein